MRSTRGLDAAHLQLALNAISQDGHSALRHFSPRGSEDLLPTDLQPFQLAGILDDSDHFIGQKRRAMVAMGRVLGLLRFAGKLCELPAPYLRICKFEPWTTASVHIGERCDFTVRPAAHH